jgi:hypothetical protein
MCGSMFNALLSAASKRAAASFWLYSSSFGGFMLTEKLRKIYEMIGEISTVVSSIDSRWYLLFTSIMHQTPREVVDAIINVQKTGEGQRQTIMAAASATFPAGSEELTIIGQLKARTDAVTGRRNAAIHTVIDIADYTIPPSIVAQGVSKRSKLADLDIEEELKSCREEAILVTTAIRSFTLALDSSGQSSPALKSPRLKAGWKNPLSGSPAK